jgi:hypothetical protein
MVFVSSLEVAEGWGEPMGSEFLRLLILVEIRSSDLRR